MNLRTLRYLVTLAEEQHFGRAAARCFVSQPTLSAQIRKLEEELDVVLIERGPGQFRLTAAGQEIVVKARNVLHEADEISDLAQTHRNPLAGNLSIGFIPTLGPYLMPHVVPVLRDKLPQMQWQLAEYQTAVLLEKLAAGELDLGVMALPHGMEKDDLLTERELFIEPFVVALPPDHELGKRKRLKAADLDDQQLLLLEDGHCLRDQALDVCHVSHHPASNEFTATSLETLRQMVAGGLGITLLPQLAVIGAPATIREDAIDIRPFQRPVPSRVVGAVWRRSSVRSAVINNICDLVSKTMKTVLSGS